MTLRWCDSSATSSSRSASIVPVASSSTSPPSTSSTPSAPGPCAPSPRCLGCAVRRPFSSGSSRTSPTRWSPSAWALAPNTPHSTSKKASRIWLAAAPPAPVWNRRHLAPHQPDLASVALVPTQPQPVSCTSVGLGSPQEFHCTKLHPSGDVVQDPARRRARRLLQLYWQVLRQGRHPRHEQRHLLVAGEGLLEPEIRHRIEPLVWGLQLRPDHNDGKHARLDPRIHLETLIRGPPRPLGVVGTRQQQRITSPPVSALIWTTATPVAPLSTLAGQPDISFSADSCTTNVLSVGSSALATGTAAR